MSRILILTSIFLITLGSCNPGNKSGESVKFQQYYAKGEQLYIVHCSNCHQKSGKGLGLLYPPLDESDYMEENLSAVLCQIRNGKTGELIVNGKSFNQAMPGVPTLTDLEIAEIATYIYNTWTHERGLIEITQVTKAFQQCGGD